MQFHLEHSDIGTDPTFEFLHKHFELSAKQFPERTALIFKNESLTFKQLNDRADNLCHAILNWAYYEDVIGISTKPGPELVIGVLAILKSGKAFMPVDPSAKYSRNSQIVKDAAISFCLSAENDYQSFIDLNLKVIFSDSSRSYPTITGHRQGKLAYLMYTSGSTCQPKGVKVTHASFLHYIRHGLQHYTDSYCKSGSFMQLPLSFDASLTSLFVPLLSGKTLVIASSNHSDCFMDKNFLSQGPYDFIKLTPLQLGWLEKVLGKSGIKNFCSKLIIGGETLHSRQLEFLRNKGLEITVVNEYGPTETTVGCMNHEFNINEKIADSAHGISVGTAIPGMRISVLNEEMKPVTPGEIGEIYISGPQVSEGYLMRPELNDKLFVADLEKKGEKMFRTGDHAMLAEDGSITYIDRAEYHLKVGEQWADPDIIEWEISQLKGVAQCKVIAKNIQDTKQLVAYIIPDKDGFEPETLKDLLKDHLPQYMIPSRFMMVSEWPYTASGKLNRHALPVPECPIRKVGGFRAPESDIEKQIAVVWRHVLNLEYCDAETGFFEMGGNHIQADRFIKLMRKHFNTELTLQTLYRCSSISCLASEIERQNSEARAVQMPANLMAQSIH